MTFQERFYSKVSAPMQVIAAIQPGLSKLQKVKDEISIVNPPGPPAQRYSKTLKIVNSFISFEVATRHAFPVPPDDRTSDTQRSKL